MKRTLIALLAPLLFWQVAVCRETPAHVQTTLTKSQSANAESLLVKLEKLDAFIDSNPTLPQFKARMEPLIAEVYRRVSRLPESDAKTDIATAARFFDLSARIRNELETSEAAAARCAEEKPGAYQRLCKSTAGSRRQLLLAKARLHIVWAKTSLNFQAHGTEHDAMLREIELERKNDQALAKQAVAALRLLENQVAIYASLSDFESNEKLARVPYETFSAELRRVSAEVENIVSWLPQNRLKFEICNALYSYEDGNLRWGSVYKSKVVSVSDLSPAFSTQSTTAYQLTVPYTVAINWRQASKYLQRAEDAINR